MSAQSENPFSQTRFDDFLFAHIPDVESGQDLTVISALARLEIDPWAEAARLAELPRESAIEQLAALIARQSDAQQSDAHKSDDGPQSADPRSIASRLVLYLPKGRAGPGEPRTPAPARDRGPGPGVSSFWHWFLIGITVIAVVYGLSGD